MRGEAKVTFTNFVVNKTCVRGNYGINSSVFLLKKTLVFNHDERFCCFASKFNQTQRRPRRLGCNIEQKSRTVSAHFYSTAAAIPRWRNEKGMGSRGRSPSLSGIFFLHRLFLLTTQKKKSRAVWYSSKAVSQPYGKTESSLVFK